MAGWKLEAHRQHDVCEFFSHLTTHMQPLLFQGEWQARRLAAAMGHAACCIDQGFGTQAIPLPIPSLPPGLATSIQVQSLVDHWQNDQDRTMAFVAPPLALALQVLRFTRRNGQIIKNRTEVHIDGEIRILSFTSSRLERSPIKYRLAAYVVHHGLTPTSGHYTAHLAQGDAFWKCDDHRPAVFASAPLQSHLRDCYLLFYTRDSSYHA